jgi:hypothetical protein
MKKIHLICKTHLDLGFTDYAQNILNRYRDEFIPNAVNLAEKLNKDGADKKFIWTTGSFLIYDSLKNATQDNRERLENAIKKGYITWHGLPFTTHTELLDKDTFEYGLSLSKNLDAKYGKTTTAAKMTDVPGHTKAIIPILQSHGIKLLHIGVNEASKIPSVPQAFLWKHNDSEVMVVYEGSYGSMYKNEYIDDILYFIHSSDNHGPSSEENILEIYKKLQKDYPDYEIGASTLDEYANELFKVKEKLPCITSEIGDSWIHGVGTDPFKTAALSELIKLKAKWMSENKMDRESEMYQNFSDNLLQLAEHTWGMDVKRYFSDFNYLKDDFNKARKKDLVKTRLALKNFYQKHVVLKYQKKGIYSQGSYKAMEYSWEEQRQYLYKAIDSLTKPMQEDAKHALEKLLPKEVFDKSEYTLSDAHSVYNINGFEVVFSSKGLKTLKYNGDTIMETANKGTIVYNSYGKKDYDFWQKNYTRNYSTTKEWSSPDFLRPGLKYVNKKYLQGAFPYTLKNLYYNGSNSLIAAFSINSKLCWENGAPKLCEIKYTFGEQKVIMELIWINKEANRLPEAMFINFPVKIEKETLRYTKMGEEIDPYDIVDSGNRNLSCVENVYGKTQKYSVTLENLHSPLVSIGQGKILQFDNLYEDIAEKGISFNLHNNIWGTNFPLWYSDNAYSKFVLKIENNLA